MIDVYFEQSLQCLIALGEFIHCAKVNWIAALSEVLPGQDLTVPLDDVGGILLEQTHKSKVKLSMSLDGVSVVGDCLH